MKWLTQAWWALIRFGFRLLYNELAWTYDLVSRSVSLGRWRSWQRAAIPHLQVASEGLVLELAHGTGDLLIDLAHEGLQAVGLDLSRHMGRIARRKLQRQGLEARLVRGNAFRLPFPRNYFDAVVSTFPTEFAIRPSTLNEVHRVLKPAGRFVIVVNGVLTAGRPSTQFLQWLYQITGQREPWPGDPVKAFETAGFAVTLTTEDLLGSQVLIAIATRRDQPHVAQTIDAMV